MPEQITLAPVPPEEAVDYFRKKGYRISFAWQDMMREEHGAAFTVAKVASFDLLQDIRQEMDKALANGTTLEEFKKNLRPILQQKGWWGRKMMIDPKTGREEEVQLGSPRRLQTIFDTNLRTSYAAGRWEQVQRVKATRPHLRYVTVQDGRTRPEHSILHGTIRPVDDEFWRTYYPPNGWNCRCTVQQLSDRDLERRGLEVSPRSPKMPPKRWLNRRTGEIETVPKGIDPGFDYNVGIARMKSLTPPPLDRPLAIPYAGTPAAVPMPAARAVEAGMLLPSGLNAEEYAERFLSEFGASISKPAVFTDKVGAPLMISADLFRRPNGKWKITDRERNRYLLLLASSIKDPDEIWTFWEEYPKGRMTLTRRYISRYQVEGQDVPAFAIFDVNNAGWNGVTAFPPDRKSYLEKNRQGALVYRREK